MRKPKPKTKHPTPSWASWRTFPRRERALAVYEFGDDGDDRPAWAHKPLSSLGALSIDADRDMNDDESCEREIVVCEDRKGIPRYVRLHYAPDGAVTANPVRTWGRA